MSKQIALLITYHNEGSLLRDCLELLLSAEDIPDEILVYDDASENPAQSHIIEHPNLRLIRGTENHGPSFARNQLLHHSTCDYVHFHDADDLVYPEWCQETRQVINTSQPDLILNQVYQSDGNSQILLFDFQILDQSADILIFFAKQSTATQQLTFRRKLGLQVGGYNTCELEAALDVFFNFRIASIASSYIAITEPLVEQQLRAGSLTRNDQKLLNHKHQLALIQALSMLSKELPSRYHNDLAEKIAETASHFFHNGYYAEAKEAFAIAKTIGKPAFVYRPYMFQVLARIFNPYQVEQLAAGYRQFIPYRLRTLVSQRLSQRS